MSTPTYPWLATPEDVAALLRSRTKDDTGRELGAWSDATRQTLDEVEHLLTLAAGQATDADGPAAACAPLCRNVIALHCACLVELSYFPEQVRSDRSPYSELRDMLVDARTAFDACRASGSPDDAGTGEGRGYHSLPATPETTALAYGYGWRDPEYPATWRNPCFAPTPETPANIAEPDTPPEPLTDIVIGHPAEGDVAQGLPPIITRSHSARRF
jgi:hypothetical protein